MRLTVIVPLYNREPFIETALHSLLRQRHDCELDVLVVNDGSTDRGPDKSPSHGGAVWANSHDQHRESRRDQSSQCGLAKSARRRGVCFIFGFRRCFARRPHSR